MIKLYVFGNEYLEYDSMARKVAGYLNDVELVHCRSPEDMLEAEGQINILDVVKDIKEPMIITDVAQLKTRKLISLHDFDLGFFLNLMENLGLSKGIKIIGIPMTGNEQMIAEKIGGWIGA